MKREKLTVGYPALLQEWDYEKNGNLRPEDYTGGSHKNIWWLCKHDHSWQSPIKDRIIRGGGCPYCSGKRVWQGYNDMFTTHPDVADQWDYEKNGDLHPKNYTGGSEKKVWWKCKFGHSWQANIYSRTKGHGCPYCTGIYAIQGENDLKTVFTQLVAEWDFEKNTTLKPSDVKPGSNRKVWWKCKLGHRWKTSIAVRTLNGGNCPYCSGKRVWQGYNDIVTTHPNVAAQWDYEKNGDLQPEQFSIGSAKKFWWKCEHGHSWQAVLYSRKSCGCPVCAGKTVVVGFNDLQTLNPNLAKEWNFEKNGKLQPKDFTAGSNKNVWWKCKLGHSWKTIIAHRFLKGCNCPYCAGRIVWQGYNDIATTHPEIADQWDYEKNGNLQPEQFSIGANKRMWWKCKYGHKWQAMIYKRKSRGCPICAGKIVVAGFNDLQNLNPDLAKEWDLVKNGNRRPDSVTKYNNSKAWWLCDKGHSWEATISDRSCGSGCPYCSRKYLLSGFNDLMTKAPNLAAEWDYEKNFPLHPEDVMSCTGQYIWWKCKHGHSWRAKLAARNNGTGCPYCCGKTPARTRLVK